MDEAFLWSISKNFESSFWEAADHLSRLEAFNERYRQKWENIDRIAHRVAMQDERRLVEQRKVIEQEISPHDSGTAGDGAELVWAKVLQDLLPGCKIVIKGALSGVGPKPSPQIDLLVLHPHCPQEVLDQKIVPIGVVLAAFECKLNLRVGHIADAVHTAHVLKSASRNQSPDPIACIPPFYGVLALGSDIENKVKHPSQSVLDAIRRHTLPPVSPMDMLDVIVVPQEFCLAARPTIFCYDIEGEPHKMEFDSIYQVQGGDPLNATPSDVPLGLFKHKLFSYLEKSDVQLERIRRLYEVFVRYGPEEVRLLETPLDQIVPLHFIDKISRHGYAKASTIFDFTI